MARSGRKRGENDDSTSAPAALVEATVACLAELGFSGTSARAVAERAGVAPGGVFYHFGSMDGLLVAVFDRCLDQRLERLASVFDRPTADMAPALAAAARDEFGRPESRAILEIVMGSLGSPSLRAQVQQGLDQSLAFTRNAIQTALEPSPVAALLPIEALAEVATSAFFGLEVLSHVGHEVDHDALAGLIDRVSALLALGAPTSPPPS